MVNMRRRDFIALLGGAAVAWPLAARAQQRAMPMIGFLAAVPSDGFTDRLRAFREGLKQTGFGEGENLAIEYRWAENQLDRLPAFAVDLVGRRVAVIVCIGSNNLPAVVQAATMTIPIVFGVSEDPVKLGLVASLARPGGNATGINFFIAELVAKRLELLRELMPKAVRLALLVNPANPANANPTVREVEAAARAMSLQVEIFNASTIREIQAAFEFARERPDALFVGNDAFFLTRRIQLATLAARHALPTSFSTRDYAEVGGLMSYGTNVNDALRQMGVYTGRILKGEKPADLPVVQSTKFDLVINLATAMALGIEVPPTLLARADEVIE
jgi:putative tryptophan/tyrosine transport system substrate-binding protein